MTMKRHKMKNLPCCHSKEDPKNYVQLNPPNYRLITN